MGQYKNIGGKRYYRTLIAQPKNLALRKAKEKRRQGVCARVAPDPDHRGYYGVYIRKCKRK